MSQDHSSRLSITHLLVWPAGIALGLAAMRYINHLWNLVFAMTFNSPASPPRELSLSEIGIATAYGTGFALGFYALRSEKFWHSPGKILLLIFGIMAILDFGITAIALNHALFTRVPTFGSMSLHSASSEMGYALAIPIGIIVLIRAQTVWLFWRFVWISFMVFAVLMVLDLHGDIKDYLGFPLNSFRVYFAIAGGLPCAATVLAITTDLLLRRTIDWWTVVASIVAPGVWAAANYQLFF